MANGSKNMLSSCCKKRPLWLAVREVLRGLRSTEQENPSGAECALSVKEHALGGRGRCAREGELAT